jgi:hypothetical protein
MSPGKNTGILVGFHCGLGLESRQHRPDGHSAERWRPGERGPLVGHRIDRVFRDEASEVAGRPITPDTEVADAFRPGASGVCQRAFDQA